MGTKKRLKEQSCRQTKEACAKIATTSEGREKHAIKLADERATKLEAKFVLTQKFAAAESNKLRFAICVSAHNELNRLMKSLKRSEVKEEEMVVKQLKEMVKTDS